MANQKKKKGFWQRTGAYWFTLLMLIGMLLPPIVFGEGASVILNDFRGEGKAKKVVSEVNQTLRRELSSELSLVGPSGASDAKAEVSGKVFYAGEKLFVAAKIRVRKGNKVFGETVSGEGRDQPADLARRLAKRIARTVKKKK